MVFVFDANQSCFIDQNVFISRFFVLILAAVLLFSIICTLKKDDKFVIILTFFIPAFFYYFMSVGFHGIFLAISILAYVFRKSIHIIVLFSAALFLIDFDKAVVFSIFYIGVFYLERKYPYNSGKFFFLFIMIMPFVSYFFGQFILNNISFYQKADLVLKSFELHAFSEDHSISIRYLYSLLSFVFVSANGIKVYAAYSFLFSVLVVSIYSKRRLIFRKPLFNECFLTMLYSISFWLSVVAIAPSHLYSRYYMFIIPFVLKWFMQYFSFNSIFYCLLFLNILVLFEISLVWL
jgi:hypothetical protein